MPMFLRLTMPAVGQTPERQIAVNVNHIVSVTPRYVQDRRRAGPMTPAKDIPMMAEGTWVETVVADANGDGMVHVIEDFEVVMGGIPEGEVH